jgi:hypothetical protein
MSIDLSMINLHQITVIAAVVVVVVVVFVVIRYFLTHVFHFLFHGCGFILLIAVVLYVLHILKVF